MTWNGPNEIGSGSVTHNGLSDFGREAIAEMERKNIIVDVSHLNDEGFAVVEVGRNRWGAIDRNNRIVIQPNFKASYEAENALRRLLGY